MYAGFSVDDLVAIEVKSSSVSNQQLSLEVKKGWNMPLLLHPMGVRKVQSHFRFLLHLPKMPAGQQMIILKNAQELTGTIISARGSNFLSTGQTAEPVHGESSAPTNSVWWTWTPDNSGPTVISTDGSGFDTTLEQRQYLECT